MSNALRDGGGHGIRGNQGVYVFWIRKPGSDIDGCPVWFSAFDGREAADKKALAHSEAIGAELVYVGRGIDMDSDRNRRFEPAIDVASLPWWAAEWIADQEKRGMPMLSKAERAAVKSLIEDSGYSRKEAEAWVRQFGVAS